MSTGQQFEPVESLHRLVKHALDSGVAKSIAEAEALFRGYRLSVSIGPAEAAEREHQTALLTCVALARRVCLGGVNVEGSLEVPLRIPVPFGKTLAEAVIAVGGTIASSEPEVPLVMIGGLPQPRLRSFHIRTTCAGWRGGIVPAHSDVGATGGPAMPLGPVLAAALAVNEAFFYLSGGTPAAGRRSIGLSLWRPAAETSWLTGASDEPELHYLPSRLWLIGLGHLGQAFLWGLGLLPYKKPSDLLLVLQDLDVITPSTESTSILTESSLVGQKKTRAMATWAERRGFSTAIYERSFDASFRRQASEPGIALCGIDNVVGRRVLDQVGFELVVEAGLGRGHRDFRTMRLHTLPGPRAASEIWPGVNRAREDLTGQEAYQKLLRDGQLDGCGVTLLAGKAVGAPFVGAVAACLALAEVLRLFQGGLMYQVIDLDLGSLEHRMAVAHPGDFTRLNPGYVMAAT